MAAEASWYYIAQIALVAVMTVYFLLAPLVPFKTRHRNVKPFGRFLVVVPLVSAAELATLFVQAWDALPPVLPTTALTFFILGVLIPLDSLWGAAKVAQAWHAHLGYWVGMAVFDTLSVFRLALSSRSSAVSTLVSGGLPVAVRFYIYISLLFQYLQGSNYIRLGDEEVVPADSMLRKLAKDEIAEVGGLWNWVKKFSIFWPWIWPTGRPRLQLRIFGAAGLALAETGLELLEPWLYGVLWQAALDGHEQRSMDPVWGPLAAVVLNHFVTSPALGIGLIRQRVWMDVSDWRTNTMYSAIHSHILHLDADYHDSIDPTDTISAVNLGTNVSKSLDFVLFDVVQQLITLWGAAAKLLISYKPFVAVVLVCVVVLNALIVRRQVLNVMPKSDIRASSGLRLEQTRRDALQGWRSAAYHSQIDSETTTYLTRLGAYTQEGRQLTLLGLAFGFLSGFTDSIGFFLATTLVFYTFIMAEVDFGTLLAFTGYWYLLIQPLRFFVKLPAIIAEDLYSATRLRRIMEKEPTEDGTEDLTLTGGCVEFRGVSFRYKEDGEFVFMDLNLIIPAGKTMALVGPSGTGKTTIFDLLMKMYKPVEGRVLIDGQDIANARRDSLRRQVGIMPQNDFLYQDTVLRNVSFARPGATDEEVRDACKKAGIHEEIMKRKNGYQTIVGTDGTFSGGECQKILLARLLLQKPHLKIILMDEATSALDTASEYSVKKSIETEFNGITAITIAHRLSSIVHAHKIIVFKKTDQGGEVAEEGSHEELLRRDGAYAELWRKHIYDGSV